MTPPEPDRCRLDQLSELEEPDQLAAGDQVSYTDVHGGLYSPSGLLLVDKDSEDSAYVAAWRTIETWHLQPENRRQDRFGPGDVQVLTGYLGLDLAVTSFGGVHVPLMWETRVQTDTEIHYECRYGSRAAAFAGHDTVVDRLTTLGFTRRPDA